MTPRGKSSIVQPRIHLQHLNFVDARLCDRIGLCVTPGAEAVELFDVSHKWELLLPRIVKYCVSADTLLLHYLHKPIAELVVNLLELKVQSGEVLLSTVDIKGDSGESPILTPPETKVLKV